MLPLMDSSSAPSRQQQLQVRSRRARVQVNLCSLNRLRRNVPPSRWLARWWRCSSRRHTRRSLMSCTRCAYDHVAALRLPAWRNCYCCCSAGALQVMLLCQTWSSTLPRCYQQQQQVVVVGGGAAAPCQQPCSAASTTTCSWRPVVRGWRLRSRRWSLKRPNSAQSLRRHRCVCVCGGGGSGGTINT